MERVKLIENVTVVVALVTSERNVEPRLVSMEDPRNLHPKESVGSCEEEKQETSQNVPLGTIDLGTFEVLSDHGDTAEDDVNVDECSQEAVETLPPLPPASWFRKTRTSNHSEVHCGKFRKPRNGDRRDEESPFFDCWDSDVLQHEDPWARNAPKCVPNLKKVSQ